ncbi:tetratricopeptide repeat protein [Campylobacter troglodytis]|uniref:tetratricopeptide repeat protein n=1 Tax=Campylobacter troglodytis TaxID=654363 RepID=UPI0011596B68|nr:tetratricopeptide repeat protein [Campylobacter troglodytis]TQR61376.1 hypothetical protein DMC01_01040 [Campylobacter troglodytis]
MKKTFFVVALFGATFFYGEVSAFDAGNINGASYGLTSNEKILKDRLDVLNGNYLQANSKLDATAEKVEGLQSTLEGINSQYSQSNTKLKELEQTVKKLDEELKNLSKTQEANNKQIKQILGELNELMSAYIGKDLNLDYNATNIDTNSTQTVKKDDTWKKKSTEEILKLALAEFKTKDKLALAKEKFEFLVGKKFKPARSHFYLGEIEYKQKNYAGAIVSYQKSVSLYSKKIDYMPTLLYHTAISFDKVGDTKRANGFYKALKADYPESAEAKAAPNRK